MIEVFLYTSVVLQIVAAVLALRMIRVTGRRLAWIFITIGLVLMAVRRIVHIVSHYNVDLIPEVNLLNEVLAFFISLVMVVGISAIGSLFQEIKGSEKALQESEERYRTLVENVNIGVFRVTGDLPGKFLNANITMARLLGYETIGNLLPVPFVDLCKDPLTWKEFLKRLRKEVSVRNMEIELIKRNGTPMIASITARAKFSRKKKKIQWIDGVLEDITERKLVENRIKESEQRLYSIIQGYSIPAFVIGRDHKILYWNRALEELTGIRADDVVGTNQHWRAFYNRERPCMADLLADGNLHEIPHWYEGKYRKSHLIEEAYEATDFFPVLGEKGKWLRFTAAAIRNSVGELVGVVETLEDITEQKEAETALKESEQRLYRVIQGSPVPTFVIGKDHKVLYWNRALEELSGIKAEDVIGTTQHWKAFYTEERPCMADLLVDGALGEIPRWYDGIYIKSKLIEEAYEATDFFPTLGETGKWLRFTAAVIRSQVGEVVGAIEILEDITERKKAEEELITAKKLESLAVFARGLAHDFNQLLSSMLRSIFAAKTCIPDDAHVSVEELATAERVALQAKELAYRLMAFAKGEEPTRKIGSIAQMLQDTAEIALGGSNITCKFLFPEDLWAVKVDEVQMRQVIDNLLLNARESMPDGGKVIIRAENVEIKENSGLPLSEGLYVKWSIKDHGKGIPKEDLPRIFDPYFTTRTSTNSRGIGLGMAICYSIVTKHNGFITVESEPNVGTTFTVYLPAISEERERDGERVDQADVARILVMDDEESVREATGIVLHYLGYNVEYAKDGSEAINLYQEAQKSKRPFSVVVLDLNVANGMGAKETIRLLKEMDPSVRAIVSCKYADDPVVTEYKDFGFSAAVHVPYDMDVMKETLHHILRER